MKKVTHTHTHNCTDEWISAIAGEAPPEASGQAASAGSVGGRRAPSMHGPHPPPHPRVNRVSRKVRVRTPSCAKTARWTSVTTSRSRGLSCL